MNNNEIMEYLGIEEENQQEFWEENKKDIEQALKLHKKYGYEFILAGDFGIYTPKNAVKITTINNIIVYKEN